MTEPIHYLNPAPRYSDAACFGSLVFLAGQVPHDPTAGMAEQTRQVLTQIDTLLQQAGSDRSRILMAQVILQDMDDVAVMNQVWETWFQGLNAPPRATFGAPLVNRAWKIEVVVTAARA